MFLKVKNTNVNDIVVDGEQVSATTPIKLYLDATSWDDCGDLHDVYLGVIRNFVFFNNSFYTAQVDDSGYYIGMYGGFGPYDYSALPYDLLYMDSGSYGELGSALFIFRNELYLIFNNKLYKFNTVSNEYIYVTDLPSDLSTYEILPIEYHNSLYLMFGDDAYIWDGVNWTFESGFMPDEYTYDNGCLYNGNMYINSRGQNRTHIYDGTNWTLEDENWEYDGYSNYIQEGIFIWNDYLMNYGFITKNNVNYFVIFRLEDDTYRIYSITENFVNDNHKLLLFNPSFIKGTQELIVFHDSDYLTKTTKRERIHNYYSLKKGDK